MKKILFLLLLPVLAYGQMRTFTNFTGAASTDTVNTSSSVVAWIESITINTSVASDTVILAQVSSAGATAEVIATYILGSTAAAAPTSIPLAFQVDSAFVTVQRLKTSDVTLIYRRR